jgi:hypothetical protein
MAVSEERTRRRNKVIHSEARERISKVIQTCDEEARKKEVTFPVSQATKRATEYCGKKETLVKKIRKVIGREQRKDLEKSCQRPVRKEIRSLKIPKFKSTISTCVIRSIIHYLYATKKEVPTAAKLLSIVTEKINFLWGRKSLTRVVKSIGFTWRKCNSKRRILIEKPEFVSWRHKYLVQMKRFREEGKEIFMWTKGG